MDLVVRSLRIPRPGETLIGQSLREIPGGKGANQAVGAARLGAEVTMVGCVGGDGFGQSLLESLRGEQICTKHVKRIDGCSSGVAVISVEDSGQNCITVVPGANSNLMVHDLQSLEHLFGEHDVLLLQLEVPISAVREAVQLAARYGLPTILDPAPAPDGEVQGLLNVDVICPNESEASALTGLPLDTAEQAVAAAERLQSMGAKNVVITRGSAGAVLLTETGSVHHVKPFAVNVVDTTAAGDAFAAALGFQRARNVDMLSAVRFACASGAVAASRDGAQPGMPSLPDVVAVIEEQTPKA